MNFRVLTLFVCFLVVSCKTENINIDGSYIKEIRSNTIVTQNGQEVALSLNQGDKIIYLVRHAEKDTIPSKRNPILTEAGYQRSYNLANILKKTKIDAIYSTLYNRTMHTVDSLGSAKGLSTKIYQPKDLKKLANDILSDNKTNTVIISGHSNTTPGLANVFLEQKILNKSFDETDYDNLLVINITKNGYKKLYKIKYK
ncbi:MAG: histidine phosphatase family protein [Saprospiraceae bacterium]